VATAKASSRCSGLWSPLASAYLATCAWLCEGKLKARFRAPVFPGDTVTTSGTLKSTGDAKATYAMTVRNQDGVDVLTADATVPTS
jgi:acyl dehydratase